MLATSADAAPIGTVPGPPARSPTETAARAPVRDPPIAAGGELVTLNEDAIRAEMSKARGHGLIVHLWATWCGPCLDELPAIDHLATAARARGVTVLSVSLDHDYRGIARIATVLRARAPGLTVAVAHFDDAGRFMSLFSDTWEGTIPALFAFDGAGKLRQRVIGEVEPAVLARLLADLAPGPARP